LFTKGPQPIAIEPFGEVDQPGQFVEIVELDGGVDLEFAAGALGAKASDEAQVFGQLVPLARAAQGEVVRVSWTGC